MPDHPMDEFRKWSDKKKKEHDEFLFIDEESFDEHPAFDEYTIGDYFQRMSLTRTERTVRVDTARKIRKKMGDFFLWQWDDLRKGWFLTLTSSEDYRNELFDLYMSFSDIQDDYMRSLARRWADEVENHTEKVITGSPFYPRFQAAMWNGKPVTKSEAPVDVLNVLSDKRAERIALNETNVVKNYERHLDLVSGGQYTHTWQTMEDERVRPHHVEADGQTVPINEPFIVMGERLLFPGDTSLGASPANICGCRCMEL